MTLTPKERVNELLMSIFPGGNAPPYGEVATLIADAIQEYGDQRAAEEREACARLADSVLDASQGARESSIRSVQIIGEGEGGAARRIAADIRARGRT